MKENSIVKIYEGSRSEQELNWWLNAIAARDAELVKTLEGMKKEVSSDAFEMWQPGDFEPNLSDEDVIYNSALDEIINKMSNTEKI